MEDEKFDIGTQVGTVKVSIGPRFLNLFSEHLYTSPNKAFEELVSNSWDAGASNVYLNIPDSLASDNAALWVVDDGHSMDVDGLQNLWSVATSYKRDNALTEEGRTPIGKFGVGKLATYLLADQLTYICKSSDGITRTVTMDYRRIDQLGEENQLHINEMDLNVKTLSTTELQTLLGKFEYGLEIAKLVSAGSLTPITEAIVNEDEYGGLKDNFKKLSEETWTIVILTHLKDAGKNLKQGWIRRMLITALPLGNSIKIKLNNEVLQPNKSSTAIAKEWQIGPELKVTGIEVEEKEIAVTSSSTPYAYVEIPGVGKITGKVKLFADSIAGGKSDGLEVSNGFFINIRGRIVKLDDPYFGLINLSHTTWAKFRATVRVDELDQFLSVNRDDIAKSYEIRTLQRFLMKLFNMARAESLSQEASKWPDAGDILIEKWGTAPLEPLDKAVQDSLESDLPILPFIKVNPALDKVAILKNWRQEIEADPTKLVQDVILDENLSKDERLVRYDVETKQIVVNANHPFAVEHSGDEDLKRLLADTALVDLLASAYSSNIGITNEQLEEIEIYRDRAYRLVAQVRRQNALQIVDLLDQAKTHAKGFEVIIGDALEYLGFSVKRLGASGEPEGVATAFVTPRTDAQKFVYKLTYDAKSTGSAKATTGNLNMAGLQRHKNDHKADFSLVVAPDFQTGALKKEATELGITPMRAAELSTLLMLTIGYGPINLEKLREIFDCHDPDDVKKWIEALKVELELNAQKVSFDTLITALDNIVADNPETPDCVHSSVIARECRKILNNSTSPNERDIKAAMAGLSLLIPNILSVDTSGNVYINTDPKMIPSAIKGQLNKFKTPAKYGIIKNI